MVILLIVFALLLWPIRFSLTICRSNQIQGVAVIAPLPLNLQFPFHVVQTISGGHQLTFLPRHGRKKNQTASHPQFQQGMTLLGTLLRADKARKFLAHHVLVKDFSFSLRLYSQNAAHSALIIGMLRSLTFWIPHRFRQRVHLHLQPDFFTGSTAWQMQCIIFTNPGILLITGGMMFLSWLLERREHQPISKEA